LVVRVKEADGDVGDERVAFVVADVYDVFVPEGVADVFEEEPLRGNPVFAQHHPVRRVGIEQGYAPYVGKVADG
jgi:hypothetical protein